MESSPFMSQTVKMTDGFISEEISNNKYAKFLYGSQETCIYQNEKLVHETAQKKEYDETIIKQYDS